VKKTFATALCLLVVVSAAACGGGGETGVSVSGDAIPFNISPDARLAGATISILEMPEKTMVTGNDGHFEFNGIEVGSEVTLTLEHPENHPIQTGTHVVGPEGIEKLTFQAVDHNTYAGMAIILGIIPDDENRCQMVTTVTRVGKSLYDPGAHGEEGATVTLDPPLAAEHGPVYFNSQVQPQADLIETSDDGGVVFIQVPPGEYTWTAEKSGVEFKQVKMKCRVGWLINASPPYGLQAL
jgi:hypothetical protein